MKTKMNLRGKPFEHNEVTPVNFTRKVKKGGKTTVFSCISSLIVNHSSVIVRTVNDDRAHSEELITH